MADKNTYRDRIAFRLNGKRDFEKKCAFYDVEFSDMLREIITAFNEGNLRIIVPQNQPKMIRGIHECSKQKSKS